MTSLKCSTALSILRCTVWRKRDGLFPNGKQPLIAIGNSSIALLHICDRALYDSMQWGDVEFLLPDEDHAPLDQRL